MGLSHVKKDVNLTLYPGSIQLPGDLYLPRTSITPRKAQMYQPYESEEEEHAKKKTDRGKSISHYVKRSDVTSRDEMLLDKQSEDEGSDEEEKPEDNKSDEKTSKQQDLSGETYKHPPDKSEGGKPQKKDKLNLSGNTFEPKHQSPAISMLASPLLSASTDSNKGLGKRLISIHPDVSPIAKAGSHEVGDTQGRKKQSAQPKLSAKKARTSNKKKRKSSRIAIFNECPSPATAGGAGSSAFSRTSPQHGKLIMVASKNSKSSKNT